MEIHSFEFDGSFPRRSYRATISSAARLRCLGKKYSLATNLPVISISGDGASIAEPSENHGFAQGRINVVLAHANGFNKELYEPFIECLLKSSNNLIKAVFVHDVVSQGLSGRINASSLGDEYSWSDSSRDILTMIHELRKRGSMTYDPIVGIGHSMGGCQIAHASMLHDRMFLSTILIDPIILGLSGFDNGGRVAQLSAKRRDTWPSKEEARLLLLKSPFYRSWHPDVFEKWMTYGLTTTGRGTEVELTTTPAQEVYSFLHFLPYKDTVETNPDTATFVYRHLKYLTHAVHLVFGELSTTISQERRQDMHRQLQNGSRIDVPDCGHLVPMEKPEECARICAQYILMAVQKSQAEQLLDKATHRHLRLSAEYKSNLNDMVSGTNSKSSKSKL